MRDHRIPKPPIEERMLITNADRIRAMSDEELCKFLGGYKFCDICEEGCDSCTYNGDCDERLLEWLKEPAEKVIKNYKKVVDK